MSFKTIFLFPFLLFSYWQVGECCPIHDRNQKIFAEVVNRHLKEEQNSFQLFSEIDLIGKEAVERGLDLSCYSYRVDPETKALCYDLYLLWEGKEQANIVFLLFAWPSQEEALKCCKQDKRYITSIHSHPIPCAYTVMAKTITEYQYQRLSQSDRKIHFCDKKSLTLNEKSVDLNQDSFIHQVLFEGTDNTPAITLHAYGCSTLEKFYEIMKNTRNEHVYLESDVIRNGR